MKVSICSGGTGGHIFPACALFESLKQRGHIVNIVTDTRGERFCTDISQKTVISTIRFDLVNAVDALKKSFQAAKKLATMWWNDRPDIIIGFGGVFTTIPTLIGKILGAKIIIYEQNAVIGRANKLLAHIADYKLSNFAVSYRWYRMASPVRKEFIQKAGTPYNADSEKLRIMVIGGSQGAISFAQIMPRALNKIGKKQRINIEIVQQVRDEKIESLQKKYDKMGVKAELTEFVQNAAEEMAKCQLVICRAGASTLTELATLGRPAILIPYPSAAENHQYYNALYYQNKKAAWIVPEGEGIEQRLADLIINLLEHRELLKSAASNMISESVNDSTEIFADFIEKKYGKVN